MLFGLISFLAVPVTVWAAPWPRGWASYSGPVGFPTPRGSALARGFGLLAWNPLFLAGGAAALVPYGIIAAALWMLAWAERRQYRARTA